MLIDRSTFVHDEGRRGNLWNIPAEVSPQHRDIPLQRSRMPAHRVTLCGHMTKCGHAGSGFAYPGVPFEGALATHNGPDRLSLPRCPAVGEERLHALTVGPRRAHERRVDRSSAERKHQ